MTNTKKVTITPTLKATLKAVSNIVNFVSDNSFTTELIKYSGNSKYIEVTAINSFYPHVLKDLFKYCEVFKLAHWLEVSDNKQIRLVINVGN